MKAATAVHVFIEIDRHKQEKLEFDNAEVTGRQIKEKAGVPLTDDLALRNGQKLELVTNEQIITLKNGEHFVVLPPGTVS
jgi:hypothetical protein